MNDEKFSAAIISGGTVTVLTENEDGTVTREDTLWRDLWPSGTVFYDEWRNPIAVKIGNLWLNHLGEVLQDLTVAMEAPHQLVLSEDDKNALREQWRLARSAMTDWSTALLASVPAEVAL